MSVRSALTSIFNGSNDIKEEDYKIYYEFIKVHQVLHRNLCLRTGVSTNDETINKKYSTCLKKFQQSSSSKNDSGFLDLNESSTYSINSQKANDVSNELLEILNKEKLYLTIKLEEANQRIKELEIKFEEANQRLILKDEISNNEKLFLKLEIVEKNAGQKIKEIDKVADSPNKLNFEKGKFSVSELINRYENLIRSN